ncbi:MAG: hypothetical protein Q7T65_03705, partial [Thiobacillus sp.]|nr:hypothetical protein [Thiobacillus sp.]
MNVRFRALVRHDRSASPAHAGPRRSHPMNAPRLIQIARDDPEAMRAELIAGLTAPCAALAPKYLYDALGSRLF